MERSEFEVVFFQMMVDPGELKKKFTSWLICD